MKMKKAILILVLLVVAGCAGLRPPSDPMTESERQLMEDMKAAAESGAKWSTYASLGASTIADGDDFMVRDISDTSPWATGEQKLYTWSNLKADLAAISEFEFPNANDTTTLVNAQAEAAHDNDDPALAVHDNTNVRYYAFRTWCLPPVILAEPDQLQPISDTWPLYTFPAEQYPGGVVVEAIFLKTSATCTDTVVFEEWYDSAGTWTRSADIESITMSGITTEDDGTLADATIAVDRSIWVDLPATPSDIAWYEFQICVQAPVFN
jgi:hypothetical protein